MQSDSLPRIWKIFTGVIIVVIISYRLVGLTQYPPGFYKDEAAMTVNGYSILKTGRDEFGISWPLFFRSFDDWKEPIFIYSQLPVLLFVGEDISATRITASLWGIATIVAFGVLIKSKFNDWKYVFFGILLLAFMPWHFHFSRIGFQLITLPFFFVLFFLFLQKYLTEKKPYWYYVMNGVLGLWFYTYYPARLLIGIYFIAQVVILRSYLKLKYHVIAALLLMLILVPAFIWNISYPDTLISRYNAVTIFSDHRNLTETARVYIEGYIAHYSPNFLFIEGATNIRHSPMFHYPFLWGTAPLLILGLVSLYKKRHNAFIQMLIVTLLTFPVASAMTTNAPHVHRIVQLIPVAALVMLLGWEQGEVLWVRLQKKVPSKAANLGMYIISVLFFSGLIFEWHVFYRYYKNEFPKTAELWFQVPDIKAIESFLKYSPPHYVSLSVAEYRKSTYQLLRKIDPADIQQPNGDVEFFDLDNLETLNRGYYLLAYDECPLFAKRFPSVLKVEEPYPGFCIYLMK